MALFNRRPKLPRDLPLLMEEYGRIEWSRSGSERTNAGTTAPNFNPVTLWSDYIAPLRVCAQASPDTFLTSFADAVVPSGGWSVYGAERILRDVVSEPDQRDAGYDAIMDGAIEFLRVNGVPPMLVSGYEWQHWISKGGTSDSWLQRLPLPSPQEAKISELAEGDTRRVAQITSSPDSNVFFIAARDTGGFAWIVDARWSDDDPRRVRSEDKVAETLYDLYVDIGLSSQIPTFWFDPELEPFFPLRRPRI